MNCLKYICAHIADAFLMCWFYEHPTETQRDFYLIDVEHKSV